MSKGLFLGSNEIARKGTDLYVGVNGVARKVSKGYVGIDGVAREFWPRYHVWNRYTIATVTVNSVLFEDLGSWGFTWNVGGGGSIYVYYTYSEATIQNAPVINNYWNTSAFQYDDLKRLGNSVWVSFQYRYNEKAYPYVMVYIVDRGGSGDGIEYRYNRRATLQQTPQQQQGTYIDQVFSVQPNTYPQNGISGSYWYVYQGTQ